MRWAGMGRILIKNNDTINNWELGGSFLFHFNNSRGEADNEGNF